MGTGQCVLVVEDHPALREALVEALTRFGLQVLGAGDGQEALRLIELRRPDLVCLDVMLPQQSGYEVCRSIRASPGMRHVRVLMMSGRNLAVEAAFASDEGADDYLAKPFTLEAFERKVRSLLRPTQLRLVTPSTSGNEEPAA